MTRGPAERFVLSRRRLLRYGGVVGAVGLVLGMPGEPGWSGAGSAGLISTVRAI